MGDDAPSTHRCNAYCGGGQHAQVFYRRVPVPLFVGRQMRMYGLSAVLTGVEPAYEAPDVNFEHTGKFLVRWRWL